MNESFTLESADGRAGVRVDPQQGGRLASLLLDGRELLVQDTGHPLTWGCYPMVPFAGRIRRGLLRFDDRTYVLPANDAGHAMHGYGFTQPWDRLGENVIGLHLGDPWPFAAAVTQQFEIAERSLTLAMSITADVRQPVGMGWHPWFRRDIGAERPASLQFTPTSMYQRDDEGLPSGELVDPPPGPWDDCFTGVRPPIALEWGSTRLALSSSVDHWVVYDEPAESLCVEPQNGPPNMSNDRPHVLEAGEQFTMSFTLGW